jgi:hypothetical protein
LAIGAVPFIGHEPFQGHEQEGAEFAFVAGDAFEVIFFKEAGEKSLGEILGIFARMSLPTNVSVERKPISAAEFLEGYGGLGGAAMAGGEHGGPMGRGKYSAAPRGLRVFRVQITHARGSLRQFSQNRIADREIRDALG